MPKPGMQWRHVIISTYASWLPGSPRGFRSRKHKIHSSGDYKNPPPKGEHAGLHRYSKEISGPKVVIPEDLRPVIGKAILKQLRKLNYRLLVIAVGATHAHFQVELPADIREVRHIVGQCKTTSSCAVGHRLPGQVWAGGGTFKPIEKAAHQHQVFKYILNQKDAWTWSYLDETPPTSEAAKPEGEFYEPSGFEQEKPSGAEQEKPSGAEQEEPSGADQHKPSKPKQEDLEWFGEPPWFVEEDLGV